MKVPHTGFWSCVGVAAITACAAGAAVGATPTAQALLAEQDAELVDATVTWNREAYALPDDLALDPALRSDVTRLVQDLLARVRTRVPVWIAEERAATGNPGLRGPRLRQVLALRSLNEHAMGFVDSAGPAHDEAWVRAALAPGACRILPLGHFARRIAIIQAAPADVRAALLAGEAELFRRWGSPRPALPPRPPAADMLAAEHAVTRLREGLPVAAAPMTPYLAGQVFLRKREPGPAERWEVCARSQWWLQSQLAQGQADRARALAVYRYANTLDASEMLATPPKAAAQPAGGDKPAYPPAARRYEVEGTTTLKVGIDEQGKVLRAEVEARDLRVPGVRTNRPVAFETLLDDAAVQFIRQRTWPPGAARDVRIDLVWKLEGDAHGAR